jgi:hypothetical protein
LSSDATHHILTHHYSEEALAALRRAFPGQSGFGVIRIPITAVRDAVQVAQYVGELAEGCVPVRH